MAEKAWPFWRTIPRFDPEYSVGDLFLALQALAGHIDEGETGLEAFLSPTSQLYFARSGRECLYLILKMLQLNAHSRVGVPLYCCASVFEAITVAGHVPVFLDVDPDTYALDEEHLRRNRDQIDALIVVHTFGIPANVKKLRASFGARDIPIIEDCAHALFSENGTTSVGRSSAASFFTFGMHKPAAIGGGAVLLVNDPHLSASAAHEFSLLRSEKRPSELQHSLICWARGLSYRRLVYGAFLSSPFGRYRDEELNGSNGNGFRAGDNHFPPSKIRCVDRILLRRRIEEFHSKLATLAANTQKLRQAIGEGSVRVPAEPLDGKWNHFMVPVGYRNAKQRELGRAFLTRRRIDTAPLYQNCARNARKFGYLGGCPKAELVAQTTCTIPNHPWLSDEEIHYIGESVRTSADLN
jgi:perosamine synthetase